jgi:hypothetical protein
MFRSGKLAYMMCALATSAVLMGCGGGDAGRDGEQGPAGPPGGQGEPGAPGAPGDEDIPSVSAITPNIAFLDRRIEVTISGNATHWSDATKVDFGPGIDVDGILVPSPTSIIAAITIDEGAERGVRDVVVSDADGSVTYEGAFLVDAPLAFDGYAGTLAQGSIFVGRVSQLDLKTPFDIAGAPDYFYLSLDAGPNASTIIQEAQPYAIDFLMLVDVNAPAADTDLKAVSGLTGGETSSLAPGAVPIMARAPIALTAGMLNMGTQTNPLESKLYSFTPEANKLVTITATASNPDAAAGFALLPPSGSFADMVSFGPVGRIVTETADPIFVVYWDNSGASGYDYGFEIDVKDSDDREPNSTCDKAQDIGALPANLVNLSLADKDDQDWFRITASAADVAKAIHVLTKPGDDDTDTLVEVFSGDCANLSPLGEASSDLDYHEDHLSKPIGAAGTYYVKVSHSPFPFAGSLYDLDIELLTAETEPNDTCAMAQATSLPTSIGVASLSSELDEDWHAITITDADVGKQLHIMTAPGEAQTDTYIEFFSGACASLTSLGTSGDLDYHEDFTTDPIMAAGVYFVKVSNSPDYPWVTAGYQLTMELIVPVDVEPANNTCSGASPATAPAALEPLSLSDDLDVDWFAFTAVAADVGKVVHVTTEGGDFNTDTVVEVFEEMTAGMGCGAGDANLVSLGVSDDLDYHEDLTSGPLTKEGAYWVKVSHSTFTSSGTAYILNVTVQ